LTDHDRNSEQQPIESYEKSHGITGKMLQVLGIYNLVADTRIGQKKIFSNNGEGFCIEWIGAKLFYMYKV